MKAEHIINRIKDEMMAASATIEEDEENDRYAEGKRLAYTNALAIILDVYSSEYLAENESDESNQPD